ncbi:hypothetical protein FPOAC1_002675 [Fusarium poae]|uniref:F-box domain-containing protein n=1 Tax=Fusarium poae TaxID=36050 RepID=A0A1B8B7B3_FUSPO|nr:hypothetical protein FPOAC1_002675 [Fusarium poae]KAG8676668.1 hypothetical protein FPOAC1_002675 [Fusarium poae]OBS28606.1 hypothetical protein FPOA_02543 [Fusarium poae]
MRVHPTSTGPNLLDLPNELICAIGAAADNRDARSLSATCRRLQANLTSVVWSRVKLSISLCEISHDVYNFTPYLGEHCERLGLIKEVAINFDDCDTRPPCYSGELLSTSRVASFIKAMTSLKSLSLDVRVLSAEGIKTLADELCYGSRIHLRYLELRCKDNGHYLMKCFGEATDPGSFKSIATPGFSSHVESLSINRPMGMTQSRSKPDSITHDEIKYIAKRYPRLKSLVFREVFLCLSSYSYLYFNDDELRMYGTMLGSVLKEKLPTLQRYVCTIPLFSQSSLVSHLSRLRPFISLVAGDHPALNEMVVIIRPTYLIRWERDSNQITLKECLGPWLFSSMSTFDQTMGESLLLNTIPLNSDE